MKQLLEVRPTFERDRPVRWYMRTGPLACCRAEVRDSQARQRPAQSPEDRSVWALVLPLLVIGLAALYLFWAKITCSWPFPPY